MPNPDSRFYSEPLFLSNTGVMPGHRIVVVGTTGSGKTTLSRQLAERFGVPHIELDALHWEPHWTEAAPDVFRQRVTDALSARSWVVDGNYSKTRDIVWSRADTLVWLDYPLSVCLYRLLKRTIRRAATHELLWGTNCENWRQAFFSRDSLFLWALTSHRRRQRTFPAALRQPAYAHLCVIRLRSPRSTRRWLASWSVERETP
jgi:adenylate kinase family enzyme